MGDGALLLGLDEQDRLTAVVYLDFGGRVADTYVVKLVAMAVSKDFQGRRLSDEGVRDGPTSRR